MIKQRMTGAVTALSVGCCVAYGSALAQPVDEPMAESAALAELLGPSVAAEKPALTVKIEPASIFKQPYLADDTKWEKAARTKWYSAQLPKGFPGKGNVSVVYLPRCAASGMSVDWIQWDEWTDAMVRAAENLRLKKALAAAGAGNVDVPILQSRGRYSWDRTMPDPALVALNTALQDAKKSGATSTQYAVFEPFCPATERGSYAQYQEQYEAAVTMAKKAGQPIPPPPPPPLPSPPPSPPPAVGIDPPVQFLLAPAATLWIATELKAQLCEIRYKAVFAPNCGWQKLYGSSANMPGRHFRYYLQKAGDTPKTGKLDLKILPQPIDLTVN